jgi:magnesium and cobalt transporter
MTPIDDFNEFFETEMDEEGFDTIGGVVLKEFGRLPRRGESVAFGGLCFTIANADNRVIRLLQVTRSDQ